MSDYTADCVCMYVCVCVCAQVCQCLSLDTMSRIQLVFAEQSFIDSGYQNNKHIRERFYTPWKQVSVCKHTALCTGCGQRCDSCHCCILCMY